MNSGTQQTIFPKVECGEESVLTLGFVYVLYYTCDYNVKQKKFRAANRLGRARLLIIEFSKDVYSLWRYGAPFPTFLKIIGTLLLCLVATLPLLYPFFVVAFTYFIYEGLFISWWLNEPWRFFPRGIFQRILSFAFQPSKPSNMWKVREVLTRGILLTHSLATSVDYLCVMQGLLEDS